MPIKVYGTVIINNITFNRTTQVTLINVAYILGYYINLISLRKVIKKNLHFNI